jgi:ABC-2 type transport system ATP-binding protein
MSERGSTVFVTTHYMEEAEYCQRLALMYRGKVIALGAPGDLKRELGPDAKMEDVFITSIEREEAKETQ